jgi:hypothetical protein
MFEPDSLLRSRITSASSPAVHDWQEIKDLDFMVRKEDSNPDPRITNSKVFLAMPINQYLTNAKRDLRR